MCREARFGMHRMVLPAPSRRKNLKKLALPAGGDTGTGAAGEAAEEEEEGGEGGGGGGRRRRRGWSQHAGVGAENTPLYLLAPKTDAFGLGFDPFKVGWAQGGCVQGGCNIWSNIRARLHAGWACAEGLYYSRAACWEAMPFAGEPGQGLWRRGHAAGLGWFGPGRAATLRLHARAAGQACSLAWPQVSSLPWWRPGCL